MFARIRKESQPLGNVAILKKATIRAIGQATLGEPVLMNYRHLRLGREVMNSII